MLAAIAPRTRLPSFALRGRGRAPHVTCRAERRRLAAPGSLPVHARAGACSVRHSFGQDAPWRRTRIAMRRRELAEMRAIAAGDPAAFARLIDREAPRLLRFAHGMLGNSRGGGGRRAGHAIRLCENAAAGRREARIGTWLHRVCYNRCDRPAAPPARASSTRACSTTMPTSGELAGCRAASERGGALRARGDRAAAAAPAHRDPPLPFPGTAAARGGGGHGRQRDAPSNRCSRARAGRCGALARPGGRRAMTDAADRDADRERSPPTAPIFRAGRDRCAARRARRCSPIRNFAAPGKASASSTARSAAHRDVDRPEIARSGAASRNAPAPAVAAAADPLAGIAWRRVAAAMLVAGMLGGAIDLVLPEPRRIDRHGHARSARPARRIGYAMSAATVPARRRWPAVALVASLVAERLPHRHAGDRFAEAASRRFRRTRSPASSCAASTTGCPKEAVDQIAADAAAARPAMSTERVDALRAMRAEIMRLAAAPEPDRAAIDARLAALRAEAAAMQEAVQRATYDALLDAAAGDARRPCAKRRKSRNQRLIGNFSRRS